MATPFTDIELATLIETENAKVIDDLVTSLQSPTGVIPFIGAGMSHEFGPPIWGDFLKLAAETDEEKSKVAQLVQDGKYEDAAQCLYDRDQGQHFRALVTQKLDVKVPDERRTTGPLSKLPLLTTGPVITTNFDRVVEAFYEAAERPFTGDAWIAGRAEPKRILKAFQENRHALIKLHGDVQNPTTLTFTAFEYEQSYGTDQKRGVLSELGNVIYTNRPLLFLGCSLETDRTLAVLKQVASQNQFLKHFAILAAPASPTALEKRREELKRAGIEPLWFMPEKFAEIDVLLDRLVERSATGPVASESQNVENLPLRPAPHAAPPTSNRTGSHQALPGLDADHISEVAGAIARGEVAFVLGSAINRGSMRGDEFYERLATLLNVPETDRNRADGVQQFVDRFGRTELSNTISGLIASNITGSSQTHGLIASLAARTGAGIQRPFVVFTTNYDDVLERTLTGAGVSHHLFLYQPDGNHAGQFLHRPPAGVLRAIVNPEGLYKLEDAAAVVVKLNGGLDPQRQVPGRFVVASRDFVEFAYRLPTTMPRVVRGYLKTRTLLFLGHGLLEPDIREFGRYACRQRGDRLGWAVQNYPRDVKYWFESCRVDVRQADLDEYLHTLMRTLEAGWK